MIDKKQCPAHTRQPWGSSTHRYSHRLRYFLMALLTFLFFSVILALVINIALHFAWGPSSSNDKPIPKYSSLGQQSSSALKDDSLFQTCKGQFGSCENLDKPIHVSEEGSKVPGLLN
ncbi:unnamed protein product [Clonostachys rhizophaga]|uniref:Uncharacterized protein n=1 Tax=Clonostachys rhizophaga TaxID=160324 RepID=A0A9N9VUQ2_9HYPO|nr:unnamed protein product [Clonostachys rhizophaga]